MSRRLESYSFWLINNGMGVCLKQMEYGIRLKYLESAGRLMGELVTPTVRFALLQETKKYDF
jgi:hypothetical protein